MLRQIFSASHWLLLLALGLSIVLLFAPISHAANFQTNVYAQAFGSWIEVENTAGELRDTIRYIRFYQDPLLFFYTIATGLLILFSTYILILGGDNRRRGKLSKWACLIILLQMGLAVGLLFRIPSYVGQAIEGQIESHFQRESLFHLFALLFLWGAGRRYTRKADAVDMDQ